jgi:beta-mannosidase
MKTGIEWMRVNRPRCMGALIWQLNDCWPGMSWSLIDSDGREKLAYFAAHDAFRNRLITIQPFDGKPWLCAVNDNDKPAEFVVHAKRVGFDGAVHAEIKRLHLECPPGSALRAVDLEAALGKPSDPRRELIHARCQGHRPTWFYLPDRELVYPKPDFEASFHESHGDGFVHVQAKSFLRDLVMLANGEEPPATPQVVTLLPGESVDFYWGSGVVPTAGDRAFQCANTFGAGT